MRAAADNVKKVTLELGGKGANIVCDDADLDLAVDGTLFGFLLMSGQACESGTRLLLHESIHDEFVRRLVTRASTLVVGNPMDPTTDVGPLISAKQKARVEKYIALGQEAGCKIAFQGTVPAEPDTRRRPLGRAYDPDRRYQRHAGGAGGDLRAGAGRDQVHR